MSDAQPPPRKPTASATAAKPKPGDGVGTPGDLVSAFLTAVRNAPHDAPAALGGPAFLLGWYLRALGRGNDACVADAIGGDFPGLDTKQGIAFCLRQAQVGIKKLEKVVTDAGEQPPNVDALSQSIREGTKSRADSAAQLDRDAFSILSAIDARLGRAHRLGGDMLDLTSPDSDDSDRKLDEHLSDAKVAPMVAALDDLATAFPPHAGHSVRSSLAEWNRSVVVSTREQTRGEKLWRKEAPEFPPIPDVPATWALLRRQGQIWRALLSGEKAGKDMLEIPDYLEAAREATVRLRAIARRFARDFPVLIGAIVLLFAIGITVILVLNDRAGVAAGAAAILASLGLSWKGVGSALGRVGRQLEEPLWGAEMDRAITRAITLLQRQESRDASEERRRVAKALPWRHAAP